jgi:hypothetical protein
MKIMLVIILLFALSCSNNSPEKDKKSEEKN